jgi:hypothetical protein
MYDWISGVLPLLCSVVSLIVYRKMWFNRKKALFPKLISAGIACVALGNLHDVTYLLVSNKPVNGLYIGFLGIIGCFLFLLSANYGQLDRLFDDSSKKFLKYRFIALVAPALIFAIFSPILLASNVPVSMRIFSFIGWIPIAFASYYNVKHAMLPDCGFVFVKAVRPYNITAFVLEISYSVHIVMRTYGIGIGILITSVVISVALVALIYFAKKGVSQWTI